MDITEQYLTPEQIKHGFVMEVQADDLVILSLKGKKLAFFHPKNLKKVATQNVATTIWEAY